MDLNIKQIENRGQVVHPETHIDAIVGNNGRGVDDIPINNSDNLVRSGGVAKELNKINQGIANDISYKEIFSNPSSPEGSIDIEGVLTSNKKYVLQFNLSSDKKLDITLRSAAGSAAPIEQILTLNKSFKQGDNAVVFVYEAGTYLRIGDSGSWSSITNIKIYNDLSVFKSETKESFDALEQRTRKIVNNETQTNFDSSFDVVSSSEETLLHIDDNEVDAKNLKSNGIVVATVSDIETIEDEIEATAKKTNSISASQTKESEKSVSVINDDGCPTITVKDKEVDVIGKLQIGRGINSFIEGHKTSDDDSEVVIGNSYEDPTIVVKDKSTTLFGDLTLGKSAKVKNAEVLERDKDISVVDNDTEIFGISDSQVRFKEGINYNGDKVTTDYVMAKCLETTRKDMVNMIKPMFSLRTKETYDDVTLNLTSNLGGKVILNLHNNANVQGHYNANRNVCLPNANSDFSDIRITDGSGNILPYKVIYKGPYNFEDGSLIQALEKRTFVIKGNDDKLYAAGLVSEDGGYNWSNSIFSDLVNPCVCCKTSQGTILAGAEGKIYRSEYPYTSKTMVLDANQSPGYSGTTILPLSMDCSEDTIIYGHYQATRDIIIEKSEDDGLTWSICYRDNTGKYQHVHSIRYNSYNQKFYAGIDGGGGVLVTADDGDNWIDLRDLHPELPQATDTGLAYYTEDYRILCGETAIVGGSTLIKTYDDETFKPVLNVGTSLYTIKELGGLLIGGRLSSGTERGAQIMCSDDDCETWKTMYMQAPFYSGGASDGYRNISKVDNKIYVCSQGGFTPLIITKEGNHAQILVDVPAGVSYLHIESGYAATLIDNLYNESPINGDIFYASLNCENIAKVGELILNPVIKHSVEGGKRFGEIYPFVVKPEDRRCAAFITNDYLLNDVPLNLTGRNFHFGFWARYDFDCTKFVLLKSDEIELSIILNKSNRNVGLKCNDQIYYFLATYFTDVFKRADFNIDAEGYIQYYENGIAYDRISSFKFPQLTANKLYSMFKNEDFDRNPFYIQHFEIGSGNLAASDYKNYIYNQIKNN